MFFHDPLYLLIMLAGMALVFIPQVWVKKTVARFSEVRSSHGYSGYQVAREILSEHGLSNVSIEMIDGALTDHYDPTQKVVRLSQDIYSGNSVSSVAIAAHECGHAIQHAKGYYPVVIRASLLPVANIGSNLGPTLLMVAVMLGVFRHAAPGFSLSLAWAGVIFYAMATAFHFVTLPVELDASGRALKVLEGSHYLERSELPGAKKVLTAAACTYIATALYALIELLYWVFSLLGNSRRNN